jgi:hypothetical protein
MVIERKYVCHMHGFEVDLVESKNKIPCGNTCGVEFS